MPYADKTAQREYYHKYWLEHKPQKLINRKKSYYKNHEHTLELKRMNWAKRTKDIAIKRCITRRKLKIELLEHYSNGNIKCMCPGGCTERHIEFLNMDHINGGGSKHIKEIGRANLYRWLRKNNYPEGFRVLCANCNQSWGLYGYCPHGK